MEQNERPELIDWNEQIPPNSRYFGFFPAALLSTLFFAGAFGCYPRSYYRMQDYYTCSPKYVCKPVPYWPGL